MTWGAELGVGDVPTDVVFNTSDAYEHKEYDPVVNARSFQLVRCMLRILCGWGWSCGCEREGHGWVADSHACGVALRHVPCAMVHHREKSDRS